MERNRKISIVIATFNAEKTLRKCLQSIVPQLSDDVELIVIDGGSNDQTADIIEEYRGNISYTVSEKDNGIYDAWNKGIKASCGNWILFIGADDTLEKDAIQQYKEFLSTSGQDLDFVSALVRYVDKDGRELSISGRKWKYKEGRFMMTVTHVASITSKKYLEHVNYFDVSFKIVGDYHLLLKGGKEMNAGFLNHIVATMTTGGTSFSMKGLKEQLRVRKQLRSIPKWLNYLIYVYQVIVFKTYNIRHHS